jgi:hypothetical protein
MYIVGAHGCAPLFIYHTHANFDTFFSHSPLAWERGGVRGYLLRAQRNQLELGIALIINWHPGQTRVDQ